MIEIGVDGCSQLGLVAFIIKFEEFSLIVALPIACCIRVIVLSTLRIHHLDLIIKQSHSLDFFFELEAYFNYLSLFFFLQHLHEVIDCAAVLVKL